MALPGSKIRHPRRLKKEKYNPLAPGIENKYQLRKSVNRRAEGNIRPKLATLNEQAVKEGQAHRGREKDLKQYYDYYQSQAQEAFNSAQEAMNQVLSTNAAATSGAQDTLLAALEASQAQDRAQATSVGGVLPEGTGEDVAAQLSAMGLENLAGLSDIGSQNARLAAGGIGRAALGRTNALQHELARFAGIQGQIRNKRTDILKELPAAREEARKDIENEELARATEREREKIARDSLKLEKRKTGVEETAEERASREAAEAKRHNIATEGIAWGQIRAEKQKYQDEAREVAESGAGQAEKEAAKAKAEQYNRGVEIFQGYFDKTKPKSYNPQTLFRNLTLAVPPNVALEIMSHGPPRFKEFVHNKRNPNRGGGRYDREVREGKKAGPPSP